MSTITQKSNYDAEVITDLDQRMDSLAHVLEPLSKMDRSALSPNQGADIEALVRCVSTTTSRCDLVLITFLANYRSLRRNGTRERRAAVATVEMCVRWRMRSSMLWVNFRFVWNGMFGARKTDRFVRRPKDLPNASMNFSHVWNAFSFLLTIH
jgi:hypothetical protein